MCCREHHTCKGLHSPSTQPLDSCTAVLTNPLLSRKPSDVQCRGKSHCHLSGWLCCDKSCAAGDNRTWNGEHAPPGQPPDNCTAVHVDSYDALAKVLTDGWQTCAPSPLCLQLFLVDRTAALSTCMHARTHKAVRVDSYDALAKVLTDGWETCVPCPSCLQLSSDARTADLSARTHARTHAHTQGCARRVL